MAIHTTDGIILRLQEVRRSSLLVTFITEGFGKLRGLMKGVRGPHAEIGYQLQLFTNNRIVFYERKRGSLFTVSQCDLTDFFYPVRADLRKMAYASYFVELVDSFTEPGGGAGGIYALLHESLKALEGDASPKRLGRILEIRLLSISGLMPGFDRCALCQREYGDDPKSGGKIFFDIESGGAVCPACRSRSPQSRELFPGTVQFIQHVERTPYDKASRVKVSGKVGHELEELMHDFVAYHVGKPIKSSDFIRKLGV